MIKFKTKQYRHKPLYKKFISLRVNAQYRRRLLLLKFKKQKWKGLISFLKKRHRRRKKKFINYDLNKHILPKFYNPFRKKYKIILQNKKKISLFYGNLLKNYLKNQKIKLNNTSNQKLKFIYLLEQRLDMVLYRSHFVSSVRSARQLIVHKHIKVNNKIVNSNSFLLKSGDVITINKKIQKLIVKNIGNSHLWPLAPKYLLINYKTLEILFLNKINQTNISNLYPFWFNLYYLIRYL